MKIRYGLLLGLCAVCLFEAAEAKSLSALFQRVDPSVVVIYTKETGYSETRRGENVVKMGLGSGVVVSKDGLIMTAGHVVKMAEEVNVVFRDNRLETAEVLAVNNTADVGLVKLNKIPDNLPVAELGDSDEVSIGDQVFVIGSPYYGMGHTLTVGHISGRRSHVDLSNHLLPIEFLQTDAALNIGNSGGPMFTMDGKVIGIVSHDLYASYGFQGLGFASSINSVKELLLNQESIWTGIEFIGVAGDFAKALNVPQEAGLLIQRVVEKSTGHRMGLRPGVITIRKDGEQFFVGGDIVLEIMGMPITSDEKKLNAIREALLALPRGSLVEIKVLRGGEILKLSGAK